VQLFLGCVLQTELSVVECKSGGRNGIQNTAL
jgi:hypothetical protein